jgi:hypothetical protein
MCLTNFDPIFRICVCRREIPGRASHDAEKEWIDRVFAGLVLKPVQHRRDGFRAYFVANFSQWPYYRILCPVAGKRPEDVQSSSLARRQILQ